MTNEQIEKTLKETGALLDGHFKLRSGLHSNKFFQAALLLQNTCEAADICAELATRYADCGIETVVSPAVGGIVVGQEVGRSLGVRAIFAEKDEDSNLHLRRGFSLKPGEKVLIAEDVITRGGRVQQTIDLVRKHGAEVVGIAIIVDRSCGTVDFGIPFTSLVQLQLETYEEKDCPFCAKGQGFDTPGTK